MSPAMRTETPRATTRPPAAPARPQAGPGSGGCWSSLVSSRSARWCGVGTGGPTPKCSRTAAQGGAQGRRRAKAEFHVGITYPQGPDGGSRVTFRGAPTANLTEGSTEAEVKFWVCRPKSGSDVVGVVGGDLSRYCSGYAPVRDGTSLALSGEVDGPADEGTGDYVVMTVRLNEPGTATVNWVDFDYVLGADGFFRRGTDTVAVDVTIRAR